MKTPLLFLVIFSIPLLISAVENKGKTQRATGSNIIYINVNIDQPNVDDCYDETGLPDMRIENWLNIFPNPNQGVFYVEMQRLNYGEVVKMNVLNTTGENVYQTDVKVDGEHYQMKLNLTHLPKGVYLLRVHADRGVNVQRLIIL